MVEYGNGIGQVAGGGGGGGAAGAGADRSVDVGAAMGNFVTDSVQAISTMPPAMLVAGFVIIVLGLLFLKRAF